MGHPQFLGGQFELVVVQLRVGGFQVPCGTGDDLDMAQARGELALHAFPGTVAAGRIC